MEPGLIFACARPAVQRGLHALGLLREDRRRLLGALGVGWGHPRGEAERAWDARLSELLAFKAEHGHLQVGG